MYLTAVPDICALLCAIAPHLLCALMLAVVKAFEIATVVTHHDPSPAYTHRLYAPKS